MKNNPFIWGMWFKKENSTLSIKKYPKLLTPDQQLLVQFLRYHKSPVSKTGLQKGLFVMQGEGLGSEYSFVRWHYGPIAFKIEEDLNWLIGLGFIRQTHSFWSNRKQYSVNSQNLTDFPDLAENLILKIRTHELMLRREGMTKYLVRLYEVFQIEQYETGTVIPPTGKSFIQEKNN